MASEVYHCKRGVNQTFLQTSHIFNPTMFSSELSYTPDRDVYPIVIHCVADEGPEESKQSHTTICVVDHHSDGTYGLRALKQKIFVDGLCYLLQEIYGIENKCNNKVFYLKWITFVFRNLFLRNKCSGSKILWKYIRFAAGEY